MMEEKEEGEVAIEEVTGAMENMTEIVTTTVITEIEERGEVTVDMVEEEVEGVEIEKTEISEYINLTVGKRR